MSGVSMGLGTVGREGGGLERDVRVLNSLSNLWGGTWTLFVCRQCGHVEFYRE